MTLYVVVNKYHMSFEGVFSTEDKANAAISKLWHPEDYEVLVVTLDEEIE